jgi:hypothetical protein
MGDAPEEIGQPERWRIVMDKGGTFIVGIGQRS